MRIPTIRAVIDRRILANFRVDPEALQKVLPPPFRPKLYEGAGVAGICLIRLTHVRPRFMPAFIGVSSENAAHRIAVEWDDGDDVREGVYIVRRDSNSWLNAAVGGKLFPGVHHHARFQVDENDDRYSIVLDSDDGETHVGVVGQQAATLPGTSVFKSLKAASEFFERGSLGYSPANKRGSFDGLELKTFSWDVRPLAVERIESSFFHDPKLFPPGSVEFDCALLMRGIEHQWQMRESICTDCALATV